MLIHNLKLFESEAKYSIKGSRNRPACISCISHCHFTNWRFSFLISKEGKGADSDLNRPYWKSKYFLTWNAQNLTWHCPKGLGGGMAHLLCPRASAAAPLAPTKASSPRLTRPCLPPALHYALGARCHVRLHYSNLQTPNTCMNMNIYV